MLLATRRQKKLLAAFAPAAFLVLAPSFAQPATVGFVAGHGEPSIDGELSGAADALRGGHVVTQVDLTDPASLGGVDVVVVAGGPDVPDAELYALDQFLMRGGGIAFLLDGAALPESGLWSNISEGNIFGYLSRYGVEVNPDLVVDRRCAGDAEWRELASPYPYCYWPVVRGEDLASDHDVLRGIDEVPLAWTSSVSPWRGASARRVTTVLLRSSTDSWTVPAYADLGPSAKFDPPLEDDDPDTRVASGSGFPLAVAVEGEFDSAFKGQQVIVQSGRDVRFVDPPDIIEHSARTRIVVFGGSMVFRDELRVHFPGSSELLVRVVDWLAGDVAVAAQAAGDDGGEDGGRSTASAIILASSALLLGLLRFFVVRSKKAGGGREGRKSRDEGAP